MKVVLFCGGFGMRLREFSESIPKPMVMIGNRPILWQVMKYYAHFGHKDFILCLGWKANTIKEYFLTYDECASNDFVLSGGGDKISLLNSDIHDWKITFVDTGMRSNIGQRLKAIAHHLDGEEMFLANYTDGLSDVPLPDMIEAARQSGAVASFVSVKPSHSFHAVSADADDKVVTFSPIDQNGIWMNGGFFVLRNEIFCYIEDGEELVEEPFSRLIEERRLTTYRYDGFWRCMDTYKEKQSLEDMYIRGDIPWQVWRQPSQTGSGDREIVVPVVQRKIS